MRIGFHFHTPALEKGGKIKMPGYIGRFLDGMASQEVDGIICFLHRPTKAEEQYLDYEIISPKISLINMGPRVKIYLRELFFLFYSKNFFLNKNDIDVLIIRGPSPLLPYFSFFSGNIKKVFMLVGDQIKGLDELSQPYLRKKIIILWSFWNRFLQDKCLSNNDLIVNSQLLYDDYKDYANSIKTVRTTTIYDKDFFRRDDTCKNNVIRLLYTGRVEKSKGLFEIVGALSILIRNGFNVELNIVGWTGENDKIESEIINYSKSLNIRKKIFFHGYQPLGESLFSFYKNCDIYILATIGNEGFPRTIWEAMAHSLPVIATKVGSISSFLSHNHDSILINPKKIDELYHAIRKIITNKKIRKKIINNGFKLSRQQTIEKRSKEIIDYIKLLYFGY
jgi:glycosyltransferase involved in cell wall biosynthesis